MATSKAAIDLLRMANGYWLSQALYAAARLKIADFLKGGPKTAEELGELANVHAPSLFRLLRALAGAGVFRFEEGSFGLTERSDLLRDDSPCSLRAMVLYHGEPWHWGPWGNLLETVRTGMPAFETFHGLHLFQFLEEKPEAADLFHRAMNAFTARVTQAVVEAYDFSAFSSLLDVGGGEGALLCEILRKYPFLRGRLLDRPLALKKAREKSVAGGFESRLETTAGDFFEEVPSGGDLYLLCQVLHDWDDERACRILAACRRALGEKGVLLVIETVIPPAKALSLGKLIDLEMMVMTPGGRERSREEFEALLEKAGLYLRRVLPTASPVSLLEAVKA
ncbi:MAG: methyltransferase [bacterium]